MKEIFKEEFEKQQKNLLHLKSVNFDITMTEIQKAQSDINELKESLKHKERVLGEKFANERRKQKNYSSKLISYGINYQADPERLEFTEKQLN